MTSRGTSTQHPVAYPVSPPASCWPASMSRSPTCRSVPDQNDTSPPRVPEPLRVAVVINLGCDHAAARRGAGARNHGFQEPRLNFSVVVQQEYHIRAVVERVPDAGVVPARKQSILWEGQHLHGGIRTTHSLRGAVRRAIVHEEQEVLRIGDARQRGEAFERNSLLVPAQDDDGDAGLVWACGKIRGFVDPNNPGLEGPRFRRALRWRQSCVSSRMPAWPSARPRRAARRGYGRRTG